MTPTYSRGRFEFPFPLDISCEEVKVFQLALIAKRNLLGIATLLFIRGNLVQSVTHAVDGEEKGARAMERYVLA